VVFTQVEAVAVAVRKVLLVQQDQAVLVLVMVVALQ
jgi:hypothetical protein